MRALAGAGDGSVVHGACSQAHATALLCSLERCAVVAVSLSPARSHARLRSLPACLPVSLSLVVRGVRSLHHLFIVVTNFSTCCCLSGTICGACVHMSFQAISAGGEACDDHHPPSTHTQPFGLVVSKYHKHPFTHKHTRTRTPHAHTHITLQDSMVEIKRRELVSISFVCVMSTSARLSS